MTWSTKSDLDIWPLCVKFNWVEIIGVSRPMQRYFSHICDGTDVQADLKKKQHFFYFSKWLIPHIRAKQDTLRGYQAFYSRYNVFIEMKMTLHLMAKYKRKKGRFVVLTIIWKNHNSSCFWYTKSFQLKVKFCTHLL